MENTYKVNKKAVEKIIERVYDNGSTVINKNDLEEIFPELKESEDERIRKALIEYFRWVVPQILSGFDNKEVLAWLEKQVEQKPAWSEEDEKILRTIISDGIRGAEFDVLQIDWLKNLKDRIQPQQEWSEGDKRIIDNLISQLGNLFARKLIKEETKDKYVNLLKSIKDRVQPNPAWGEKDRRMLIGLIDELDAIMNKATPDEISVYSKYTNWLKSLKDRVQPKQEWNEEDEITRMALINLVEMYYGDCINKSEKNRLLDWLKSLRPQNTWKPSDEQMDALNDVISSRDIKYDVLSELWQNLNKLREE